MIFQGTIQKGFGTGAFYVQLPHYFQGFTDLLGAPPYPGTLNVLFSEKDNEELNRILSFISPSVISGKQDANLGDWCIECYPCEIWKKNPKKSVRGLILRFSRPDHEEEVIELVSAHFLREKFTLEDGDLIKFLPIRV
ncbi:MAG: DUF120 domain-containing protein [Candidatus Lokiarchaeota archaeon]|nr:DUF120 domain-containing protein [Candidatus Lokiarchaeota archaeon]